MGWISMVWKYEGMDFHGVEIWGAWISMVWKVRVLISIVVDMSGACISWCVVVIV